jgi:hypothetical protein
MWLDDCRIPFVDEGDTTINHNTQPGSFVGSFGSSETIYKENTKGRFTPNLLVCDDMLNDGIKPNKGHRAKTKVTGYGEFGGGKSEYHGIGEYMEVDSKSRYYDLDKWFDKVIEQL